MSDESKLVIRQALNSEIAAFEIDLRARPARENDVRMLHLRKLRTALAEIA